MIQFTVPRADATQIKAIVRRAVQLYTRAGISCTPVDIEMDLTACHVNGCPLDLSKLLQADDFNLMHDVVGIARHLNRTTGQLDHRFWPRCAIPNRGA